MLSMRCDGACVFGARHNRWDDSAYSSLRVGEVGKLAAEALSQRAEAGDFDGSHGRPDAADVHIGLAVLEGPGVPGRLRARPINVGGVVHGHAQLHSLA